MKKQIFKLLLASLSAVFTLTAPVYAEDIEQASQEIFAMDTYMTVTGYGEKAQEAVQAAIDEITRLDALLSVGNADSEIFVINEKGQGTLSSDTAAMVEEALHVYETSGGKFDITIYPLMEAWGFTTGDYSVPSKEEIDKLLQEIGSDKLTYDYDSKELILGKDQGIDLGGIAKGYTSGRIMEIFEEYGLVSGVVSLGGNVQCYKTKPDGSLWRCGIQDPTDPDNGSAFLGILSLEDEAVITSGAYERNFTDESTGKIYHHIIDPASGYPADNGLISTSIITSDGTLADALSTSMYILGLDDAITYWQNSDEAFDMILMTEDNEVYITPGIKENFNSDYPVTIIS